MYTNFLLCLHSLNSLGLQMQTHVARVCIWQPYQAPSLSCVYSMRQCEICLFNVVFVCVCVYAFGGKGMLVRGLHWCSWELSAVPVNSSSHLIRSSCWVVLQKAQRTVEAILYLQRLCKYSQLRLQQIKREGENVEEKFKWIFLSSLRREEVMTNMILSMKWMPPAPCILAAHLHDAHSPLAKHSCFELWLPWRQLFFN